MLTEIVAHDALGQHDQALALFAQLGNPAYDSKIALDAGAVLVKHVGSVADADQLERVPASHEIVSKLHRHMAPVMLLRGYTANGNLDSVRIVFDEMLKRRFAIPKTTLKNMVALVADQSSPDDAMRMIERMLEAKVPVLNSSFNLQAATRGWTTIQCTSTPAIAAEQRRTSKRTMLWLWALTVLGMFNAMLAAELQADKATVDDRVCHS
nr:hypothetical protein HK105_002467 [Polyrhizophydium stewartii]